MEDSTQQPSNQSAAPQAPFPSPPPLWKHFTTANLARLKALRTEFSQSLDAPPSDAKENSTTQSDSVSSVFISTLPPPLRALVPPPPPPSSISEGTAYTIFSTPQPLNPLLPTLPPNPNETLFQPAPAPASGDLKPHLHALTDSLLLSILSLTSIMSTAPEEHQKYTEHIERVMVNVRMILDRYRPGEARRGVVRMLERKIEGAEGEIGRLEDWGRRAEGFLDGVGKGLGSDEGIGDGESEEVEEEGWEGDARNGDIGDAKASVGKRAQREMEMWRAVWEVGAG